MEKEKLNELFEKWCKKLRIVPAWDVKLEFVDDPEWRKTGDFKIDCDDRKAAASMDIPTFFPIPDQKSFSFEKSFPDIHTMFAAPMTFSHNTVFPILEGPTMYVR